MTFFGFGNTSKVAHNPCFLGVACAGGLHVLRIAGVLDHGFFLVFAVACIVVPVNNAEEVRIRLLLVSIFFLSQRAELGEGKDSLTLTSHHHQIILVIEIEQLGVLLVTIKIKQFVNISFYYLLSLEESQTVNCLEERVHNEGLRATEVVELHGQILNKLFHSHGLCISILLLVHQMNDERAGVFDVVDGEVLAFRQFHNGFFVEAPLAARDKNKEDPRAYYEPDEATQEDCQFEEVLVNEE